MTQLILNQGVFMKKCVLLTMTVLLVMSGMSYGDLDTIKGNTFNKNSGEIIDGIQVSAISESGQVLTQYTTALSKGYMLIVTSGQAIHVVPSRQDYDFSPKEYYYPTVNTNLINQHFDGYDGYMPLGPTIVNPAKNAITSSNPTFIWNKLNVPKYYSIIISTLATLKDTIYIKDSIPKIDTTFTIPITLKSSTTYYFKILSITYPSSGKKTGSSIISNFKTDVNSNIIPSNINKNTPFNIYHHQKINNIKYYDFKGRLISINNIKKYGYYSVKISFSNPIKRIYVGF